jgi:hypothetical protein
MLDVTTVALQFGLAKHAESVIINVVDLTGRMIAACS